MDRDHYKHLCLSILENELYYEKQANHQSKNVMNKLSKIIEEYGQELTKKEINYLLILLMLRQATFTDYRRFIKVRLSATCVKNHSLHMYVFQNLRT